jgi:[acyl-carrier-protein] S-malonyltransferase
MIAYIFPGQGSQFPGMGKELFESNNEVKAMFLKANEILGYDIAKVMFEGTEEDLKETKITQPAMFLHSMASVIAAGDRFTPDMVAGHSLGELSALTAAKTLSFESGLLLVNQRAIAMQEACEMEESTMAAILGLTDEKVEEICAGIPAIVSPANYNCPGQIVISGSKEGIEKAMQNCLEQGAMKAIELKVAGAFHSVFMEPARQKLEAAINNTIFGEPICPVYQNVDALKSSDPEVLKSNLLLQLTAPVKWTQSMIQMIADGAEKFVEVGGNGRTLLTFVKRIDRTKLTEAI